MLTGRLIRDRQNRLVNNEQTVDSPTLYTQLLLLFQSSSSSSIHRHHRRRRRRHHRLRSSALFVRVASRFNEMPNFDPTVDP